MAPDATTPFACTNCGAKTTSLSARYCEYCGTVLPRPEPETAAASSPFGDVAARLGALESHPDLSELMQREPRAPSLVTQTAGSVIALAVVLVVGLVVSGGVFAVCPPLGLLPLVVLGLAAYAITKQISKSSEATRAPLERLLALVVDERTHISGGGQHSSARTEYFTTLELGDGERRELSTFDTVAGSITRGDAGVAYVKGSYLVYFARLVS